jgi:hypothetical protein
MVFKEGFIFFLLAATSVTLNGVETRKNTEWKCSGVLWRSNFCVVSSIWDVHVVVGRKMIMWQGNCPSEVRSTEISWWSGERISNRTNK